MVEISIIIITRNRQKLLKQCLNSLAGAFDSDYEIIVVDNASQDKTVEMLKDFKNITLIKNQKNLGVAPARNVGLRKARGKFIILLDDDTLIKRRGSFLKIIDFMKKHKKVAMAGPKLLYPDGQIQESARQFPTLRAILWRGTFLHKLFPNISFYKNYILKNFNRSEIQEVDWVIGACQIIRKDILNKIGLLDEKYFFGYEDIDFCFRIKQAGFKVIYYPFTKVVHYYKRESAKGIINRAKLEHIKSILRFFYKVYFKKI